MSYECFCGQTIDLSFPTEYVFDRDDEVFQRIVEGEIFRLECPQCGFVHRIEERALFRSRDGSLVLQFLTEDDRTSVLRGDFPVEEGVHRLVVGYRELVEKVLLWKEGLDDRAIEALKFGFLLQQERRDVILTFAGTVAGRLEFWVEGLGEEGKVGKTGVSRQAYAEALAELDRLLERPRLRTVLSPPRVCVRDLSWPESSPAQS